MTNRRVIPATTALAALLMVVGGCREGRTGSDTSARATGATDTVRVLIYNVRHGAGMNTDSVDLSRSAAVIREVDPDVVLLQEIDRGAGRTGQTDQAAELSRLSGLEHHAFGAFMAYDGGEYGMAALSRWPFEAATNHRLPDGSEPRSSLEVAVRSPRGFPVRLAGIHLYETEPERLAQAGRLLELFAGDGDGPVPVILAGDFNSLPDSPVLALLSSRWQVARKPDGVSFTFPASAPEREIDYFLVPNGGTYRVLDQWVVDERVASDHRPVLIVLEVARPQEAS